MAHCPSGDYTDSCLLDFHCDHGEFTLTTLLTDCGPAWMSPARPAAQVWAEIWPRQALPEQSSLNVDFTWMVSQAFPVSTDKVVIYRSNTKASWHF